MSFLPDAEHHGKYFALCVEPGMGPVMSALQRVEVKAFDLIVAFHGAEKGAITDSFEFIDAGFVQPFVAPGFTIAGAIGDR